jgi:hypothetical protein
MSIIIHEPEPARPKQTKEHDFRLRLPNSPLHWALSNAHIFDSGSGLC